MAAQPAHKVVRFVYGRTPRTGLASRLQNVESPLGFRCNRNMQRSARRINVGRRDICDLVSPTYDVVSLSSEPNDLIRWHVRIANHQLLDVVEHRTDVVVRDRIQVENLIAHPRVVETSLCTFKRLSFGFSTRGTGTICCST